MRSTGYRSIPSGKATRSWLLWRSVRRGKRRLPEIICSEDCPVAFYPFFGKAPFAEETERHATLARTAEHVVGIDDAFEEDVVFGDGTTTLKCYLTVLDYVEGDLLQDYLDGKLVANAENVCQIAIDLPRIRGEFEAHKLNHNDLHAENLIVERLASQARRIDAIDGTRGPIGSRTTSGPARACCRQRQGARGRAIEYEFVAEHLRVDKLGLREVPANVLIKGQDGAATGYWVGHPGQSHRPRQHF